MRRLFIFFVAFSLFTFSVGANTVTGVLSSPTSTGGLKNASISFTLDQGGVVAGSFVLSTTPVICGTDESGSIVGLVEPLANPSTSINYASGSLPAATYFVRLTYWNASGETQPGPESSFTLTMPGTLTIVAPALQPSSASGYKVYIGTVGADTLQSTVTGWASYARSTALASGSTIPSSNTTACDVRFNDSIIPTDTVYMVSVTSSTGAQIPGFSQPWVLAGGSLNVTNNYPIAVNRTARFPYPIIANPSSNALQSINSPLTLNGYSLFAGSIVLSNNVSPPGTQAGRTIFYTDSNGMARVCQNGNACVDMFSLSGGWSVNGTDIRESVATDAVLIGASSSDLTPQGGGSQTGALVVNQFMYAVSGSSNARVAGIGVLTGASAMTIASGVSGTQTTGWPLTFRVCPLSGDCSALGTTEAMRMETGGKVYIGLGAATTHDFVSGELTVLGGLVAMNGATNAQVITIQALGGGSGAGIIESTFTGTGSYKPLQFRTNGSESGRFTVAHQNFDVGNSLDAADGVISGERDQNSASSIAILNGTAGTAASASFHAVADSGSNTYFGETSTTFTPSSGVAANSGFVLTDASGGLDVASAAGTIRFHPGGATTEMTLTNGTGVTLAHALPVASGGTGNTSTWSAAGAILFASGTSSTTSSNLFTIASSRLNAIGGITIQAAARTNPSSGEYLQQFFDSGVDAGAILSYDYGAGAYKPLKISALNTVLNANGTDVVTVQSSKVTVRLASVPVYANNAAAIAGGLAAGDLYRANGDPDLVAIVH